MSTRQWAENTVRVWRRRKHAERLEARVRLMKLARMFEPELDSKNRVSLLKLRSLDLSKTVLVLLLMSIPVWAVQPEQRTAYAVFNQAEGCVETEIVVKAVQNWAGISTEWPDGWAKAAWLIVQQDDTCAGVQVLNAAGQAHPPEIEIDRKLNGAAWIGQVETWDGISRTGGWFTVQIQWAGYGDVERSSRLIRRSATASVKAEGMGVGLSAATESATLEVRR